MTKFEALQKLLDQFREGLMTEDEYLQFVEAELKDGEKPIRKGCYS